MNSLRVHAGALTGIALAFMLGPAVRAAATDDPAVQQAARDGRRFAVDLYERLAADSGNFFYSPWSARTALLMTYAGARGQTEQAMSRALHDSLGQAAVHLATSLIDAELRDATGGTHSPGVELLTANAVWVASNLRLDPAFPDTLTARYSAPPLRIRFGDPESARATINGWVEEQTRSRIRELIPSGAVSGDTRLVLCNAIYFRASWSDSFSVGDTRDSLFHLRGSATVTVPFMHANRVLRYAENRDLQVLELPYRGRRLAMLILLPRAVDGLETLERELNADSLSAWMSRVEGAYVHLTMPRFRIEDEFRLAHPLIEMGMQDAFGPGADFTGITSERPLFISEVYHKTFVAVEERGTEAAAATAVVHTRGGGELLTRRQPVTFTADRPLLFLIFHPATGTILFMGRLADPR